VVYTLMPWHFANMFMFPFILKYCYEGLQFTAGYFQLIGLVGTLFGLVFASLFGIFIDHYGYRTTLLMLIGVHMWAPLFYLVSGPERLEPIWLAFIMGGTINPVVMVLQNTLVLSHAPRGQQSMAFGLFSVGAGVVMALAPLAADTLDSLLRTGPGDTCVILGHEFFVWQIVIATAALFRMTAFVMALRLPKEEARPPAWQVVRHVVGVGPFRPFVSLYRLVRATASKRVFNGVYAAQHPSARWKGAEPVREPCDAPPDSRAE
jgi:MFS family permease